MRHHRRRPVNQPVSSKQWVDVDPDDFGGALPQHSRGPLDGSTPDFQDPCSLLQMPSDEIGPLVPRVSRA